MERIEKESERERERERTNQQPISLVALLASSE